MSEEELKKELEWLENTPFYIGRDGMPSLLLLLFIFFTGIIFGIIIIIVYRNYRKKSIRKELKELSK